MDWLQFISGMTGHLAWPAAAIVIAFMFREQVNRLLEKMTSLKAPGIEASFSSEAAKVAAQADKIGTPAAIIGPAPEKSAKAVVQMDPDARTSAVVIAVWQKIESMMVDLLDLKQIDVLPTDVRYWNVNAVIESLFQNDIISAETADLLHSLYRLRNHVAHNDMEPEERATREFMSAADKVITVLDDITARLAAK